METGDELTRPFTPHVDRLTKQSNKTRSLRTQTDSCLLLFVDSVHIKRLHGDLTPH